MTLATLEAHRGLTYNADFFSPEDMADLAAAEIPADMAASLSAPPAGAPDEAESAPAPAPMSMADVDAAIAQFRKDLAAGVVDIDDIGEADMEALSSEVRDNLARTFVAGQPAPEIVAGVEENLGLARVVEADGMARLEVDGTVLLEADLSTPLGRKAFPVMQLVAVVMDIVFVLIALAGVATAFGAKAKKAAAGVAKSAWKRFKDMVESFVNPIRTHIATLREARKAGRLAAALKNVARPLCKALFNAGKAIYQKVWKPTKHIFALLFDGAWAKGKALMSLGAFICGLFATAGMAMLAAVLNLASTLVGLAEDTIKFVDAVQRA